MEMAYCISYAWGHHRTEGVNAWHDFGGFTNNYLLKYVHYNISKGCPHNYLSEYVHKYIYRRVVHKQTNIFVLKTIYHT